MREERYVDIRQTNIGGFQLDLCEEIAFNFTFMKNGFQLYLCEKYFSTLPL
jgi:hypothetical protein